MHKTIDKLVPFFESATSFVGVTGSVMAKSHQEVLKLVLPNSLSINFSDIYKFNSIEREPIITSTVP
jgi:hypothetical protein